MNIVPQLQFLLMLVLGIVLPEAELALGKSEGRIGEPTRAAVQKFLVEQSLTIPSGLQEESSEWFIWLIRKLEAVGKPEFTLYGQIQDTAQQPLSGVKLQAFDRDLPSLERRLGSAPQMLGESLTNDEGRFRINYTLEQFRTGEGISSFRKSQKQNADISFQIFDRTGQELTIRSIEALEQEFEPDQIIFNAPVELEVSILIEPRQEVGDSEYERLVAAITPVLQDLPIAELTDEDIRFLVNELGLEQQLEVENRIKWLRHSAVLARETNLPIEAFYGWGRKDLPAALAEIANVSLASLPSVLNKLVSLETAQLTSALVATIDEKIIPASLRDRATALVCAARRLAQTERAVRLRLEDGATGEALPGYSVTTFDTEENSRDLGTDVTEPHGEFTVVYFVAAPTADDVERSLRFRVRGATITEAIEVIQKVRPNSDAPISLRITLPDVQPPLRQLSRERLNVPEALLQILDEKHSIKSLADIRRRGGLDRIADLRNLDAVAINRLDALADLDRLSKDLNETLILLEQQYNSVVNIAEMPRSEFIASMSSNRASISERRATELHIAAKAQTEILNQIFAGIAIDFANGIRPSSGIATGDYFPPFPEEQQHA